MIRKCLLAALCCSTLFSPAYAEEADTGGEIIVTARAAKLYRVEETASGKLPTEPLASSQSITVLTSELIKDQGARDAQDLYRNISGVSVFSYAGVTARGFRQQENFYDGLRGDPYIGFAVPQLFNIERVEFLKGPAGMLYGQTAPGGLFNYVTKKPSQEFSGSVSLVGGTQNRYGAQAEVTGPVNDVIALRAGAFFEDRDLQRTFAGNRSLMLDVGATADFGIAKLTAQVFRIEQDLAANRLRGIPVDAQGHFLADREWNHNEPSDYLDLRSTTAQLRLDLKPSDDLALDAAVRRIDASEAQRYHEPIALLDTDRDGRFDGVARQYRVQFRDNDIWSFGVNAVWSKRFGGTVSNRLLVGFDYSKTDAIFDGTSVTGRATAAAGLPCPLSFANPVYRACDPAGYALPPITRDLTETTRRGFYLLDELTIGRLILIAGIRTDRFDDVSKPATGAQVRFKGDDEKLSPRRRLAAARRSLAVRAVFDQLRAAERRGARRPRRRPLRSDHRRFDRRRHQDRAAGRPHPVEPRGLSHPPRKPAPGRPARRSRERRRQQQPGFRRSRLQGRRSGHRRRSDGRLGADRSLCLQRHPDNQDQRPDRNHQRRSRRALRQCPAPQARLLDALPVPQARPRTGLRRRLRLQAAVAVEPAGQPVHDLRRLGDLDARPLGNPRPHR